MLSTVMVGSVDDMSNYMA